MDTNENFKKIKQLRFREEGRLLSMPGVVGVGSAHKIVGGEETEQECLCVYVEKKEKKEHIPLSMLIPPKLSHEDGSDIHTDIIETGKIYAHSFTNRARPAPAGISIGHFSITAGTLGAIAIDVNTGGKVILSNNHVLANSNIANVGDPILQPGPYDGGMVDQDTIAKLARWYAINFSGGLNLMDAAIAEPIDPKILSLDSLCSSINPAEQNAVGLLFAGSSLFTIINPIQPVLNFLNITLPRSASVILNMQVHKCGRTTEYTAATVRDIDATISVNYGNGHVGIFTNQIITGYMSAGGDSGSVVYEQQSKKGKGRKDKKRGKTKQSKIDHKTKEHHLEHEHWDFPPAPPIKPGEHGLPLDVEERAHEIEIESICGGQNDSQPVEQYDGTLGVTRAFVDTHQAPAGQLQWNTGARTCSGTLISSNLFLTAGHCFPADRPVEAATEMHVNFNYQVDSSGNLRTEQSFNILELVEYRLGGLDYAIVRLEGNPGSTFGFSRISNNDVDNGAMLCIIQHPAGLPKRIEAGPQFHLHDSRVGYDSIDTLGGSSGSGILHSPSGLLVGVHTNGGCTPIALSHNHGVRITSIRANSPVIQNILSSGGGAGICSVENFSTAVEQDFSQEIQVSRDFRDKKLKHSTLGKKYLELYEKNEEQITKLLRSGDSKIDAVIKEKGVEVFKSIISSIQSSETSKPIKIDNEKIFQDGMEVLEVFSEKGDKNLKNAIKKFEQDAHKFKGKTIPEILEMLDKGKKGKDKRSKK